MSRGFVKEEDQEEAPMIPPRAALPPGQINYVTSVGYQALLEEKKYLEESRKNRTAENETERRREAAVIDGKLNLLNERISSARIIDFGDQPKNEVRFGAKVKLKNPANDTELTFQIVGVDEGDVKKQKIAFVAPIAAAITGKKIGDVATLKLGKELRKLKIVSIQYLWKMALYDIVWAK